ncbi:triose-phosphate isomerase [Actinospica sp. MGRD01-02]|uniref:Triosephosphate isomerase n=2 Tax=Actinospica acidithermotolerans TaxID=2828514 RepID=A0A941IIY8_9ACTN|nr:triose-phosphate isomerase [Actinospica acidithermotolerans]
MAGNWKMNLNHFEAIAHVQKIAYALNDKDFAAVEVAVLAPFTDLRSIQTLVDGDKFKIKYGAQDVSQHESGAYTGEISAAMLAKLKCDYVIVGHSERREYHGESDAEVAAKAAIALKHEISPIICFGEKLHVRQSGEHVAHCVEQLTGSIAGLTGEQLRKSVLAYEPVWAIGTGEVATPADAQEVIGASRAKLAELYDAETADAVRILYGGSVKGSNAAGIMAEKDVDGALIGGASLDPEDFVRIVRYRDTAVA